MICLLAMGSVDTTFRDSLIRPGAKRPSESVGRAVAAPPVGSTVAFPPTPGPLALPGSDVGDCFSFQNSAPPPAIATTTAATRRGFRRVWPFGAGVVGVAV